MNIIEQAKKLRSVVEKAMQSIDGNEALTAKCLYPEWEPGRDYAAAFKVQRAGKLWQCIQGHTAQNGWEPENAPSLWEQINETHAGTLADPIPYTGNMALTAGLYYVQDAVIYLCIRDTVSPVYHALSNLLGLYTEII